MSQSLRTMGAFALGGLIVAVAALSVRPGPVAGAPTTGTELALHTLTVSATARSRSSRTWLASISASP